MRWVARVLAVIVLCGALLPAGVVHADDVEDAQALYVKAREAYDALDYNTAYTLFNESQRLDPAPGTVLNLALSSDRLGRLTEASRLVNEVLEALDEDDERRPVAEKLRADLDDRMPLLTIEPGAEATVLLDGALVPREKLGTAIPLDPGSHELVIRAAGHQDNQQTLTVGEHERPTIRVVPGPPLEAPQVIPEPPDVVPAGTPWWGILGWSVAGAGVASLGVTAVMAGLIVSRDTTVNAHCSPLRVCDDIAFAAAEEGKTFSNVGTATFIAGVVAIAGGLTLAIPSLIGDSEIAVTPVAGGGVVSIAVIR